MFNCLIGNYEKQGKRNITLYTVKLIHNNVYQIRINLFAKNGQSCNTILKNYDETFKLLLRNKLINKEGIRI